PARKDQPAKTIRQGGEFTGDYVPAEVGQVCNLPGTGGECTGDYRPDEDGSPTFQKGAGNGSTAGVTGDYVPGESSATMDHVPRDTSPGGATGDFEPEG